MAETTLKTVYCVYFDSYRFLPEIVAAYTDEKEAYAHVLARAREDGYETLEAYEMARADEELQDWYTVVEVPVPAKFVD